MLYVPLNFTDMQIWQIADFIRNGLRDPTPEEWVEAENIFLIRSIIIKWFRLLESGEAQNLYPDPFNNNISQEIADWMVREIEADFLKENGRWAALERDAGPGFDRLPPHARLSMAQEVYKNILSPTQIKEQTEARLKVGEIIPPKKDLEKMARLPQDPNFDDFPAGYYLEGLDEGDEG